MTPLPTIIESSSILNVIFNIGRQIMIDFGLAGLFERFERRFGKWASVLLEAVIYITILVFCISLIWAAISPLVNWTTDLELPVLQFPNGFLLFAGSILAFMFISQIIDTIRYKKRAKLMNDVISEFSKLINDSDRDRKNLEQLLKKLSTYENN